MSVFLEGYAVTAALAGTYVSARAGAWMGRLVMAGLLMPAAVRALQMGSLPSVLTAAAGGLLLVWAVDVLRG